MRNDSSKTVTKYTKDYRMQEQASFSLGQPIVGNPAICAIKDQVSCDLSDEAVILQLQDGIYYGLDPVGASVWKLIQTPKTIAEVRDAILEEYDVTPEQCEADLRALLANMKEQRLVTIEDRGA
jgi:hypothetical protein